MPTSNDLQLELLKSIQDNLKRFDEHLQEMSGRVLKIESALEAHDYHGQLNKIIDRSNLFDTRLTILETKGRTFTAGVSAAVSVIVSIIAGTFLYIIKGASH